MIDTALLLLVVALVAANALFVAAEFSLVTVDRASVEQAAARGDRAADSVLAALRQLSFQLSGAQLGITVTSLVVGFVAEPAIASLLEGPLEALGVPESTVGGVALTVALLLATAFQMVFGELVPKNLGIARPLPVARRVVGPQRAFSRVMKGPIAFLNGNANRVVRLLGMEPQEELRSARSPNELASLARRSAAEGLLASPAAALLERSLRLRDLTAAETMTPRVQVSAVPTDATLADVLEVALRSGHSRFPVTGPAGLDDIQGVVHVKQAFAVPAEQRAGVGVTEVMTPAPSVPETIHVQPLLTTLREQGLQLAVVVDEYGGTAGIVTVEDVVEELVGSVADEHDQESTSVVERADGSWSVDGLLRMDEVTDATGVQLPEGPYETIGGLVTHHLERIPAPDDVVEGDGWRLRVLRMDRHRVHRLLLQRFGPEEVG